MNSKEYKDKPFKTNEIKVGDIPGINQVQYTPGLEVKKGASQSKTLYFTKTARAGIGVVNYTGFGFQPTAYIIQAWYKGSVAGTSTSYCTNIGGVIGGFYQYPGFQNENTTRAVIIWNAGATITTRANFSAFISDGIALDFVDSGNDIRFTITAFK